MKIGFIGAGNMGSALANAVSLTDSKIFISDNNREKAESIAKGVDGTLSTNSEIASICDLIFLAVKPNILPLVLAEIKPCLENRTTDYSLVSMAAGVKIEKIENILSMDAPIIRIMPNTSVSVGEGMILYAFNESVSEKMAENFKNCLCFSGELEELDEKLIDAGCAVSGCGPAFVYMFIDALSDGGVAAGLPRDKARKLAIQTLLGASALAKETGKHPDELKDAVCSPGGSTIEGVKVLEEGAFRGNVIDAVIASYKKTVELGK